ncbi:MAG: dipeptidase [Acidobacteria bacterium]|nr:dipeptidase [Acidobacteriota bacterium]
MQAIIDHINRYRQQHIDDLIEFVKIPSISCSSEHKLEVERCARFLAAKMREAGLSHAEVIPTAGHPVVYGEWLGAPGRPTMLIYGHYDVQPVEPLDLWQSPPFEPSLRGENLYGRGTIDDKGQVYVHLKAIEAYFKARNSLPLNLKFIVEGEEEIGSEHLAAFLLEHRHRLDADVCVISDTPMLDKGVPSICYGLRGLTYMEVEVRGPRSDLHSGSFGGTVANPAQVLAQLIVKLKDVRGRLKIPGFYDKVVAISDQERSNLASLPFREKEFLELTGSPKLTGETGYSTLERLWARPTLDVNGLVSGHTGEGAKTIIPGWALAKISMRLVPHQDPDEIAELFTRYVLKSAPRTVRVEVRKLSAGRGFLAPYDHPAFQAAIRSLEKGFGRRAVFIREGGSIPFVGTIHDILQKPCILLGFGLPDENSHAPNERLNLDNYHQGIISVAHLYDELARLNWA